MKTLLALAIAAAISAPALAADDDPFMAGNLLPQCTSTTLERRAICMAYVRGTIQSLFTISLTDVDDTKDIGKRGVGKICVTQTQVIAPEEVIRDSAAMLAKMPILKSVPAAMVMLATIRNRFPCKK